MQWRRLARQGKGEHSWKASRYLEHPLDLAALGRVVANLVNTLVQGGRCKEERLRMTTCDRWLALFSIPTTDLVHGVRNSWYVDSQLAS